tara:strand:- start:1221 stop:1952 length:732 start_codon:yes stop_codon:yes gene_type:complete
MEHYTMHGLTRAILRQSQRAIHQTGIINPHYLSSELSHESIVLHRTMERDMVMLGGHDGHHSDDCITVQTRSLNMSQKYFTSEQQDTYTGREYTDSLMMIEFTAIDDDGDKVYTNDREIMFMKDSVAVQGNDRTNWIREELKCVRVKITSKLIDNKTGTRYFKIKNVKDLYRLIGQNGSLHMGGIPKLINTLFEGVELVNEYNSESLGKTLLWFETRGNRNMENKGCHITNGFTKPTCYSNPA